MRKNSYISLLFFAVSGLLMLAPAPLFAQRVNMLEAEKKLASLGYWITRADGRPDVSTRHSITAFQKVEGLKRTGVLDASVMRALRSASRPMPRYTVGEKHVEVDLKRQVLFVVDEGGKVTHVLPVSTGNDKKFFDKGAWNVAITPRGAFDIYNKINGTRRSTLGDMYYPSYFIGGVAMHGSNSIPPKPASHGCVRVPRFAEKALFRMTPIGMTVYVYD